MAVDPSILRKAEASAIAHDKPCHNCGYNLIGLAPGSPCPECGTHIPVKRTSVKGDNLTDAPIRFLRRLAWTVLLNAISLPATIIAVGAADRGTVATLVAVLIACVFVASTWLVTSQRSKTERSVNDNILDNAKLRTAIRFVSVAWPLYAAAYFVQNAAAAGGWSTLPAIRVGIDLIDLVATLALVPLFVHHSAYAAWAGDSGLDARFRGSAWLLVACSALFVLGRLVMLVAPLPLVGFVGIGLIFVSIVYVGAAIVAIFGVVQLAMLSFSAITSNRAATERDARVAARRAKEMSDTVDRQFSAPPPVDPYNEGILETQHIPADTDTPPPPGQLQRIEADDDLDAYDLAPPHDDQQR